jgi:glycosyltransferase involved in cell wall biosynthesis
MAGLIGARDVGAEKLHFIPNWADEGAFRPVRPDPALRRQLGLHRPFTVMYAGNLGEVQGLDSVVEAARLLRAETAIGFAFVGAGVAEERLHRHVRDAGLDNVTFVPAQPFERMAQILALGDVQLVPLKDVPLYSATLPSKLQANMAAGRPVIAALAGDGAAVVERAGAGVVAPPECPPRLAEAVRTMSRADALERQAMGLRAREYYLAHFSEKVVGDTLSDLLCSQAEGTTT